MWGDWPAVKKLHCPVLEPRPTHECGQCPRYHISQEAESKSTNLTLLNVSTGASHMATSCVTHVHHQDVTHVTHASPVAMRKLDASHTSTTVTHVRYCVTHVNQSPSMMANRMMMTKKKNVKSKISLIPSWSSPVAERITSAAWQTARTHCIPIPIHTYPQMEMYSKASSQEKL